MALGVTEISAIIGATVAAVGVLVGVVYYILDIRHQSKVRQTDLIMRLHSESSSKEMVEALHTIMETEYTGYEDFVEKYGPILGKRPEAIAFGMVATFYEGIGILVHRKLADVDLVFELFPAQGIWRKIEPLVRGMREKYGMPDLMEWFEYLYNELQKRQQLQKRGA